MDQKAMYSLSYGVFVLGTKSGDRINACITNTCFQTAAGPVRIAISVISQNLTCEMIKESGVFSLSVLDKSCTFDTIKNFGYSSGRSVDKFRDFKYEKDSNGCPYITEQVCAVLKCKVTASMELGSHTLFVAEVQDAKTISSLAPLTYAEYQKNVKPEKAGQSREHKKIIGWRCKICGYELMEEILPEDFICPMCGHPAEDFEPIYEQ